MLRSFRLVVFVFLSGVSPALVLAQTPAAPPPAAQAPDPPPPPGWTGSFGAGLALTQGNSDTSTVNLSYDVLRDTGSNVLFKSVGLFLRGESEGELTTNRLAFEARVDRRLTQLTSLFVRLAYLRDEFKQIDYLVSPTVGPSRFLIRNARTELAVDGGVGIVWEKNPGFELKTDGAVTAGQTFKYRLSETAEITERAGALWKMDDFEDGLYVVGLGVTASLVGQTQVKVELLDTFKNKPPTPEVKKNDIAVLLSFVFKY